VNFKQFVKLQDVVVDWVAPAFRIQEIAVSHLGS